MNEEILSPEDGLLALVVRAQLSQPYGVQFHSSPVEGLQIASIRHPAGADIEAHTHPPQERTLTQTQEVLVLLTGKLEARFYDCKGRFVKHVWLYAGDVLHLVKGGHGFTAIDEVRLLEIKQGPYNAALDKVRIRDAGVRTV